MTTTREYLNLTTDEIKLPDDFKIYSISYSGSVTSGTPEWEEYEDRSRVENLKKEDREYYLREVQDYVK